MTAPIEQYLTILEAWTGTEGRHDRVTDDRENPPVWVFSYPGYPVPGGITGFTYGLSSVDNPLWRLGKPETVISVDSESLDWPLAGGFLVKRFRGKSAFEYGDVLRFGERIVDESEMSAVVVFIPTDIPENAGSLKLPDRTINLVQLYPIYEEEIDLIRQHGPEEFLTRDDVDFHDVHRPNLGKISG